MLEINSIQDLTNLIEELKRRGDYSGAHNILEQTIAYLEDRPCPDERIPPWYHEQLSIVLKKLGHKEEAIRVKQIYDEIVIRNFIIESKRIEKEPKYIRERYWPDGPVITKKVIESAKRLIKTNPALVKAAGLLDHNNNIVASTPTQYDLDKLKKKRQNDG